MRKLNSILENEQINVLINDLNRSSIQLNKPHESDAEIIKINKTLLALTTDSISEEISSGLYDDPYLLGWMIVTVNISDLAAVCAKPLGILISEIFPKNLSREKISQVQKGISAACSAYNTFVLGGDTNEGESLVLNGTAIGTVENIKPTLRLGCKSGDILFSTGKLGGGSAYAISKLILQNNSFPDYKPLARLDYGKITGKYASCCMDTSDGLISTLDQLMRLNNVGFELNENWQNVLDADAVNYVTKLNIPAWLLFAGQHGEFELIFTVPSSTKYSFLKETSLNGLVPIELGKVIKETEIKIPLYGELIPINTTYVRNLPVRADGDVNHYLKMLLDYDFQIKNEPRLNFTFH